MNDVYYNELRGMISNNFESYPPSDLNRLPPSRQELFTWSPNNNRLLNNTNTPSQQHHQETTLSSSSNRIRNDNSRLVGNGSVVSDNNNNRLFYKRKDTAYDELPELSVSDHHPSRQSSQTSTNSKVIIF